MQQDELFYIKLNLEYPYLVKLQSLSVKVELVIFVRIFNNNEDISVKFSSFLLSVKCGNTIKSAEFDHITRPKNI